MIEWIINNKEWIFSGIGVMILLLFIKPVFRLFSQKKSDSKIINNIIISENIKNGNSKENIIEKQQIPVMKYGIHIKNMTLKLSPKIAIVSSNLNNMSFDKIVDLITHKIIVHSFIFQYPNPSTIIPINSIYFGSFFWDDTTITCEQLFQIPIDADLKHWKEWTYMQSDYVEIFCSEHRQPNWEYNKKDLSYVIAKLNFIIESAHKILEFETVNSKSVEMTIIEIKNILERINLSNNRKGPNNPIVKLEMAISYAHDIIKRLMPRVINI